MRSDAFVLASLLEASASCPDVGSWATELSNVTKVLLS
jgi:hypothetical protein